MPASNEHTQAAYTTIADSYHQLLSDVSFEATIDLAMVQHFVEQVGFHRNGELLDAGCGTGRMMTHLSQLDPSLQITGIDFAHGMVDRARLDHPDRQIDRAALTSLPFRAARFDGVLCWYSIIHTPEAELGGLVAELARVLRPQGSLLLAFHTGSGQRVARRVYGHDVDLTVQLHDVSRVAGILATEGFMVQVRLERAARPSEKDPQGFLLATRG